MAVGRVVVSMTPRPEQPGLRRALAASADQARRATLFYSALLAQLEAETLGADSALARIDEAWPSRIKSSNRCNLAFLHRLRGESC